jgi:hypothetical protein
MHVRIVILKPPHADPRSGSGWKQSGSKSLNSFNADPEPRPVGNGTSQITAGRPDTSVDRILNEFSCAGSSEILHYSANTR